MVTFEALQQGKETLAVVGLGYVGLPLAVALSRRMNVLGFDISAPRIKELQGGHDRTREWYAALKSRPSFRPLLSERMEIVGPPEHYDKVDF